MRIQSFMLFCSLALAGCARINDIGREPDFTTLDSSFQHHALYNAPLPEQSTRRSATDGASLWSANQRSLLGDRRAGRQGDILTVVIEINDSAEMSNSSGHSRSGSENMAVPQLLGIPQQLDEHLPAGASSAAAVETSSGSSYSGDGTVRRNERLTLRVASTVVERLPNGVLRIEGSQEVRVNFELRELLVTGFVRPEDITRQNEVTYDKIAGARISYGGRGQISAVQQPRIGQQIADIFLPF
jgi:flagellar L-ring protein precursor FlgH